MLNVLKSIKFWLYLLCMFVGTAIICVPTLAYHYEFISGDNLSYLLGLIACSGANFMFTFGTKILDSYKKEMEVKNNGNI